MSKHFYLPLICMLFCVCSDLSGQNPSSRAWSQPHPNQYFVKLCHGVSDHEVNALLSELNSVQLWRNDRIGLRLWAVKEVPYSCSDGDISDINQHLVRSKRKTNIEDAMLNRVFQLEDSDDDDGDDYFGDLDLDGTLGSTPVRIAILDSGISDDAIATNTDYSGPLVYTGYDYVNDDPEPEDMNGHGTHIAGLIYEILRQAGTPTNVTFDIRKTHDAAGFGDISALVAAIVDAVDAGANIINMSFSYYEVIDEETFDPLRLAIEYAEQRGVLVVASAGNYHQDNDASGAAPVPASLPNENIFSVASNRADESLSSFSNYGAYTVDISTLGEGIPGPGLDGGRVYASGTSFSTAIVTALSGILGTRQDQFNGCEIKCTLIHTADNVSDLQGLNQANGVLDFAAALQSTPNSCAQACSDIDPNVAVDCGVNCPPETSDIDICVEAEVTVVDKLLVYDAEQDVITFAPDPVYGPFFGTVSIQPDGSFAYTSWSGSADLFVYQVCDDKQAVCSDGCNQGVVYINSANCRPPSNDGGYVHSGQDCVAATNDKPKLLTFRYTGQDCSASDHAQDPDKVHCYGDPAFAPVVYVSAIGEEVYFTDLEVALNETFSVDAASIGEDKLKSEAQIYLKDANGQVLQMVEFHTSGSEVLRVEDQFASLVLEGYLSENDITCGNPQLEGRDIYDCAQETDKGPKLLTFRYTGQGCDASDHAQDSDDVICTGDPSFAPVVYVRAVGDQTYFDRLAVPLNATFSIDAASIGEDKLPSVTTIYLEDAGGQLLQTIELHTSGSQPLGLQNQFASLVLEGYLSEEGLTCGNPDLENRNIIDCDTETGEAPRLLTFRYNGQSCAAMDHIQDPDEVVCSGDPGSAPIVYITAISSDNDYYLLNREVALDGTFSIDAANVGANKLKSTTTIYLKNETGQILQTLELQTSGSEPLGLNDRFASLDLIGYLGEYGGICGKPRIPTTEGDCCDYTGEKPQILTLQYTGDGCQATNHHQDPDNVSCSGAPNYAPFVYITGESVNGSKRELLFSDLQVPLNGIFDVDAMSIGEKKFKKSLVFYIRNEQGDLLQEVAFLASCSEPLGAGNQFGALQLKGYVAENGEVCGEPPVSEVCNPIASCTMVGKRSTIGLIYLGETETSVAAFAKAEGENFIGSYQNVGPGDFVVFSSLYRNESYLGYFFVQWSGSQEVEIPVATSEPILGNVYGDFKVVQQLDQESNDCRIAYSSCSEINRQCGALVSAPLQRSGSDPVDPVAQNRESMQASYKNEVHLYPNPARQVVYLDLAAYVGETLDIVLYDAASRPIRRIREQDHAGALLEIHLQEIPNGVYFFLIRAGAAPPISKKLVVARN